MYGSKIEVSYYIIIGKMSADVFFDVIDKSKMLCKVVGVYDHSKHEFIAPPAPLKKDDGLRLVCGKYPLSDYRDGDGSNEYILEGEDGTTISGRLVGFTVDCRVGNWDLGIPRFQLRISSQNAKGQEHTAQAVQGADKDGRGYKQEYSENVF